MEEKNVETSTQETNEKFTPIMCPHCKSKNLAFVTEYHKSIGGRIVALILLAFTVLLAFLGIKQDNLAFIAVSAMFGFSVLLLVIFIIIAESKTHIQCICKDCGFDWLKN